MSALLCHETLPPRSPAAPGGLYRCLPGQGGCACPLTGGSACDAAPAGVAALEAASAAALEAVLSRPWRPEDGLTLAQHDLACAEKGAGLCALLGAGEGRPGVYSLACVTRYALGPLPRVLELATAQDRFRALQIRRQYHALCDGGAARHTATHA